MGAISGLRVPRATAQEPWVKEEEARGPVLENG